MSPLNPRKSERHAVDGTHGKGGLWLTLLSLPPELIRTTISFAVVPRAGLRQYDREDALSMADTGPHSFTAMEWTGSNVAKSQGDVAYTLKNISLTCRLLRDLAYEFLYARREVRTVDEALDLARLVSISRGFDNDSEVTTGVWVKRLCIPTLLTLSVSQSTIESAYNALITIFQRCKNLQFLHIGVSTFALFCPRQIADLLVAIPAGVQHLELSANDRFVDRYFARTFSLHFNNHGIFATLIKRLAPNLSDLRIDGPSDTCPFFVPVLDVCPNMTHLRLSQLSGDLHSCDLQSVKHLSISDISTSVQSGFWDSPKSNLVSLECGDRSDLTNALLASILRSAVNLQELHYHFRHAYGPCWEELATGIVPDGEPVVQANGAGQVQHYTAFGSRSLRHIQIVVPLVQLGIGELRGEGLHRRVPLQDSLFDPRLFQTHIDALAAMIQPTNAADAVAGAERPVFPALQSVTILIGNLGVVHRCAVPFVVRTYEMLRPLKNLGLLVHVQAELDTAAKGLGDFN